MKRLDHQRRHLDIVGRTPARLVRKSDLGTMNCDIAVLRAIQVCRPGVAGGSGGGGQTI